MIYLDYTANTPADPAVLNAFIAAERRYIANPNSTHIAGQQARAEMDRVTSSIAQHLGVQPAEIIYTSGASEANNLAVKGIAQAARHIGKHIISTELEHSSVGASLSVLQQQGYEIDLLRIGPRSRALTRDRHLSAHLRLLGQRPGIPSLVRAAWHRRSRRILDAEAMHAPVTDLGIIECSRMANRAYPHFPAPSFLVISTCSPAENHGGSFTENRSKTATALRHLTRLRGPTARYDSNTCPRSSRKAMSLSSAMPNV